MMKWIAGLLGVFVATVAAAQTYPTCPSGSPTSCTITVTCAATSTPIFNALSARQYLVVHNQGYLNATVNAIPICIAVGTQNHAVWDSTHNCNGFVIDPGHNWEPWEFTAPQLPFRVPPTDIACVTPFGSVAVTGEQE